MTLAFKPAETAVPPVKPDAQTFVEQLLKTFADRLPQPPSAPR